jgi:hypothetical protein
MPHVGNASAATGPRAQPLAEVDEWLGYRLYWSGGLDALERHLDENPNERRPDGDGCALVFTHAFDDRALGAQHTAGWVVYLNRLDSHLAGNFLPEQEAHEASPSCTSATLRASGWRLTSVGGVRPAPQAAVTSRRRTRGRATHTPGSSSLELTKV